MPTGTEDAQRRHEELTRERRRRQRELIAAGVLVLVVLVATWVELTFFGVDSWMFLALFNVNLLLSLVVLFLVVRNSIKLLVERRRNVPGAKLRTRLVLMFMLLSLAPTVIMFLASNRVVATSVDYWFKNQAENAMDAALDVGQSFYTASASRLRARAELISREVAERRTPWGSPAADALLDRRAREYGLIAVGFVTPAHAERNWHAPSEFAPVWDEARKRIAWDHVAAQRFGSLLWAGDTADYVIGALAIDAGRTGYLVVAESIGQGLMLKLDRISKGFEEYKSLKNLKRPLKVSFTLILGILSLLVVLGALWLGLRLSRELTAPILALADGADRIAKGDLDVRLEDSAQDEIGQLVRAFNKMAGDLAHNRQSLTEANRLLAQSNAEIAGRNAYIEAVLDNIAAGVISLDASGRIQPVNKAAASILGTPSERLKGRRPAAFLDGPYLDIIDDMLTQLHRRPEMHWERQMDLSGSDRALKLLVHAVALRGVDGSVDGIVAVFEDISELERMQRMAAWREVARRIAHEIKNPLTPIKLSAQRLERKFGPRVDDPVFGQCTALIVKQVEHLQQMVQEFSTFAKLPEVTPRAGDITPLLEEVTGLFRHGHSRIAWQVDIAPALPPVRMDGEALHRAFINILTNAIEALEGTATPSINVQASHDAERARVRVEIADNGPGLTPEERSRMFEPYFTSKKGGTGLGLSIVRSIVNDHGGHVRAAGAPGGGTVVTVELPVA